MKYLFLLLLTLPITCISQDILHAEKFYNDSTGRYLIEYTYDCEVCQREDPSKGIIGCNYPATITVYKYWNDNTFIVAGGIEGIYSWFNNCLDNTELWVKKAKEIYKKNNP